MVLCTGLSGTGNEVRRTLPVDKKAKIQYTLVFLSDLFSLVVSSALAWLVLDRGLRVILEYERQEQVQFFLILACVFLLDFLCFNHADGFVRRGWKKELLICAQSSLVLAAGLAVVMLLTKAGMMDSRYLYTGIVATNAVMQYVCRMLLKTYLSRHFYKGSMATLVGVVTTTDRADKLVKALKSDWTMKVQGAALLDWDGKERTIHDVPVTAGYEDFMDWVRREPLDAVYIDVPYQTGESLRPYVREIESMGPAVHLNVPVLEQYIPHGRETWMPRLEHTLEETGGSLFVTLQSNEYRFGDMVLKRLMDIVGSLVGCLISLPIIAVVAIPLKLESPGPLLFKQKRVGLNGRVFNIYKLRSMYQDAEARKQELMARNKMSGLMFKMDDDPRITRVGRFIRKYSIDELPQFFNVLIGQMSLVGTRPPTLDEYSCYQSHHKGRLSMKPGLTGMWQISGRSDITDFEEVVKLDMTYIDNWSLQLDIKILFKTIGVVLRGHGAE